MAIAIGTQQFKEIAEDIESGKFQTQEELNEYLYSKNIDADRFENLLNQSYMAENAAIVEQTGLNVDPAVYEEATYAVQGMSPEERISYLQGVGIDPELFGEVETYVELGGPERYAEEQKSTLMSPGKVIGSAIGSIAEDTTRVGGELLEGAYRLGAGASGATTPEQTAESLQKIKQPISDLGRYIDDTVGQTAVGRAFKRTVDPELDTGEEFTSEVAEFVAPFAIASKALKVGQGVNWIDKAARGYVAAVGADLFQRDEDEQYTVELIDMFGPESEEEILALYSDAESAEGLDAAKNFVARKAQEYADALRLNPNDTVAERRVKQLQDAGVLDAAGSLVVRGAIAAAKLFGKGAKGVSKTYSKSKAIKEDKVLEPVEGSASTLDSGPTVAKDVEAIEIAPQQYRQRGKLVEYIGKANTGVGRLFTSQAGLPKKLFDSYLKKKNFVESADLEIKGQAKKLNKELKGSKVDREAVDNVLRGDMSQLGVLKTTYPKIADMALDMRKAIDANQATIKEALDLPKDSKLGAALDSNDGVYVTKSYEFITNPKWSKDINKALSGKLKPKGEHNTEVIRVVENARSHIRELHPNYTAPQVDHVINEILSNAKSAGTLDSLVKMLSSGRVGEAGTRVLKARKKMDKPVIELLGEIKDPVENFQRTMQSQNRLIAKAQYLRDVKQFAEANLGKEVELGGLLPGVPTRTTTFLNLGEGQVSKNVGELVEKELGPLGGTQGIVTPKGKAPAATSAEKVGLNQYVTTEPMYKMLEDGIDLFAPSGKGGVLLQSLPTAAAFAQSAETVFDHTAHMVNVYGMLQQLAANGNLVRPSIFKNSVRAAKAMYERARKGDPDALEFLRMAKERGVIDSSMVTEPIKANLDMFTDGLDTGLLKLAKKPVRAISAVYGGVDDFGKIVALQSEIKALQKTFPDMTDEAIFDRAADTVRNTMPSYGTAAPAVRALSRLPFGTYATFPAEILRTSKNIISIGARDIRQGLASGNKAQVTMGMRRLGAFAGVGIGVELAINNNNEAFNVSESTVDAIDFFSPEYQRSSEKLMLDEIRETSDGRILARYVDTASLDAHQYVKGPIRTVMGKALAGEGVTQREIDDMFGDVFIQDLLGPYFAEKALTDAIVTAYTGIDDNGQPIRFGMSPTEDALDTIAEVAGAFRFGSVNGVQKHMKALESEDKRGLGKGQTRSGFPLNSKDTGTHLKTGIRPNTMDLRKTVGYAIYKDIEEVNKTVPAFKNYLKGFEDRSIYQEDIQDMVAKAREYYTTERDRQARLSDSISKAGQIVYTNKKGNRVNFGLEDVIRSATSDGERKLDKKVIGPLIRNAAGGVYFHSNLMTDRDMKNYMLKLGWPVQAYEALKEVEIEFTGQLLRGEQQ
mgnify:FL=1